MLEIVNEAAAGVVVKSLHSKPETRELCLRQSMAGVELEVSPI